MSARAPAAHAAAQALVHAARQAKSLLETLSWDLVGEETAARRTLNLTREALQNLLEAAVESEQRALDLVRGLEERPKRSINLHHTDSPGTWSAGCAGGSKSRSADLLRPLTDEEADKIKWVTPKMIEEADKIKWVTPKMIKAALRQVEREQAPLRGAQVPKPLAWNCDVLVRLKGSRWRTTCYLPTGGTTSVESDSFLEALDVLKGEARLRSRQDHHKGLEWGHPTPCPEAAELRKTGDVVRLYSDWTPPTVPIPADPMDWTQRVPILATQLRVVQQPGDWDSTYHTHAWLWRPC